jgi:hypothetical protein
MYSLVLIMPTVVNLFIIRILALLCNTKDRAPRRPRGGLKMHGGSDSDQFLSAYAIY